MEMVKLQPNSLIYSNNISMEDLFANVNISANEFSIYMCLNARFYVFLYSFFVHSTVIVLCVFFVLFIRHSSKSNRHHHVYSKNAIQYVMDLRLCTEIVPDNVSFAIQIVALHRVR